MPHFSFFSYRKSDANTDIPIESTNFDTYQDVAEIVSLILTAPTLLLSLWVVWLFRKDAIRILKTKNKSSTEWLVLGVAVGFLGSLCDNAYWGLAWTAHYLDLELSKVFFDSGVFFNVPFRQISGIVAGYCHVRCAFTEDGNKDENVRLVRLIGISLAIGGLGAIVLSLIKTFVLGN